MKSACLRYVFILIPVLFAVTANAQGQIEAGMTGVIRDSVSHSDVSFRVSLSGAATSINFGSSTYCGITWPAVVSPWTGNTSEMGTITYTFSRSLHSVDLVLSQVGMNGYVAREKFLIKTDRSNPVLTVHEGSCAEWTVDGNQLTSANMAGGQHVVVHVESQTPFTVLTVFSGDNSGNGGSGTGLLKYGAHVEPEVNYSTPFIHGPPPAEEHPPVNSNDDETDPINKNDE